MDASTLTIIVSLVAVVIAGIAIWQARKAGTPITGELLQGTLATATTQASEIVAIVQSGVFAAEMLKNTGRLPDGNAAFNYALKHAQKFLPDLDRETLTTFIESSVLLANQIVGELPSDAGTSYELPPQIGTGGIALPPPAAPYGTYTGTGRTP